MGIARDIGEDSNATRPTSGMVEALVLRLTDARNSAVSDFEQEADRLKKALLAAIEGGSLPDPQELISIANEYEVRVAKIMQHYAEIHQSTFNSYGEFIRRTLNDAVMEGPIAPRGEDAVPTSPNW